MSNSSSIGSAYVDIGADTTKFNQQMSGLHNQLSSSLNGLSTKSTILMGAVMGGMMSIVQMGITKIMQMFNKMTSIIKESISIGTRVETLGTVLEVVGRNAGYTSNEMGAFVNQVTKMGITTQEAMQNLTKMAQAQLDLAQAHKLARVAQDAAVIGNVNSSEAFGRILHGITTLQPEILRTIGIIVSFEAEYAKAAATMGKNVNSLSQQEKQQIAFNATIAQGAKIQGVYEASMSTANKQIQSMKRYTEELKLSLGSIFNEAMFTVVMATVFAFKDWNKAVDELKKTEVFNQISHVINTGIKLGLEGMKYLISAGWEAAKELYDIFTGIGPVLAGIAISVGLVVIPIKTALVLLIDVLKTVKSIAVAFIALGDAVMHWSDPESWTNLKNVLKEIWKDMEKVGMHAADQSGVMLKEAERFGTHVAGETGAPAKTREEKAIEAERARDLQIISQGYIKELGLKKQIDELNKNDQLSAKKKAESIKEANKALLEEVAHNKKIQEMGIKSGYNVVEQLKKSSEAFAKGNVDADIKKTKSGIEEAQAMRTKSVLKQQQENEALMKNKKAMDTAALDSQLIQQNAINKKSMEQRKADFEYDKLLMQQAGSSEIEIAKFVKQHKDDIANKQHADTLAKIAIESQKENIEGKIGGTGAAKKIAAQKDLESQLYENQKQHEIELLKIREKSNSVMLSYYQFLEPTSQKTLELMKKQWELEAQRMQAQLDVGQVIDKQKYVSQKEAEFHMKQQIDNLEYEENKKLSLLAIDEQRGRLSADYIASAKITSYQKLLDMYEKEKVLKANDANAQLTIKKKMDDVTRAIEEQRYALELLHGTYEEGITQGVIDYYNQMKTTFDYGKQTVGDFASTTKDSIGTVFKDLRKGELKSFVDYFNDFCDKIADKWIDMLSEMLTNWIMTQNMMKSGSTGGGEIGGIFGILAKGLGFGGGASSGIGEGALGTALNSSINMGESAAWGYTVHSGGLIGHDNLPMRAVPASLFNNAPRFHNGLSPDEFPAILQKGEAVFTKGQMANMSSDGAPTLVVNVENKTDKPVKATQSQPQFDGKRWIRTVMLELADSDMAVRSKYGTR